MSYHEINGLLIKPHERYPEVAGYPNKAIIIHHRSYYEAVVTLAGQFPRLRLASEYPNVTQNENCRVLLVNDEPVLMINTGSGTVETQTAVIKTSMTAGGGTRIINLGAAGAIDPKLKRGAVYTVNKAVRDCGSTTFIATPEEKAVADIRLTQKLQRIIDYSRFHTTGSTYMLTIARGDSWSVPSMYYPWHRMDELNENWDLKGVEMEDAATFMYSSWLNFNYGPDGVGVAGIHWQEPIQAAAMHYISDILPKSQSDQWIDTLNPTISADKQLAQGMYFEMIKDHFALVKGQLMYWAINALCNAPQN